MRDPDGPLGSLRIDRARRTATLGDCPLSLTPKAFDLLLCLAEHRDRTVEKDELRERIWPDVAVDEANLTQTVFMLRRALRQADPSHEWVVTVPRLGYRLVIPDQPEPQTTSRDGCGTVENPRYGVALLDPSTSGARPRFWFAAAALGAMVLAVLALTASRSADPVRLRSVAILPFDNHYGAAEQFLADGITDQLARQMGRIRQLRVVSHGHGPAESGTTENLVNTGRTLGVDAVLSGEVRRAPKGLTVSASLVEVPSGRELWRSEQSGLLSALGGQRSVGARLVRDLFERIWPEEPPPEVTERSAEAQQAYLHARSHLGRRTPDAIERAIAAFRDATARDETFAEAHAGLADAYTLAGIFGVMARDTAARQARDAAMQALALDGRLAEAHTSLAFGLHVWEKRWVDAEARYRRAIELDPSYAQAHHWYALLLDSLVRPADALREMDAALALDPLSPVLNSDRGMILAHHGRFGEAIEQFRKTVALDPTYADVQMEMGWACAFAGRYEDAQAAFTRALSLGVPRPQVLAGVGYAYAASGRLREARDALRGIEHADVPDIGLGKSLQALVLLGLGEHDRALGLLLDAFPNGDPNLKVGRIYDPIRQDPRFEDLLRRSGF